MIEKNKIENLFQEKLNNFEVHPPDEVWMNIENELKKKKEKRRVIPFWWKLSGIAALLVIGFSIYDDYLSPKSFGFGDFVGVPIIEFIISSLIVG